MNLFSKVPPGKKGVLLVLAAEFVFAGLVGYGVAHELRAMNAAINELSALADPSPYRAALMGHLGKIHLALQGFLRSADPTLSEQLTKASEDFEAELPEFQKQNPKLFPRIAMEEISRTFGLFQQAVHHTLEANSRRQAARTKIDENFTEILRSITQNIRPLIRDSQPDAEERREAALVVENQARAWQQNLIRAWSELTESSLGVAFDSDNRGSSYIEQYMRLDLLPRERKVLKHVQQLWEANGGFARSSFALERVVLDAESFMKAQREQVVFSLNKYLPALSVEEFEARKQDSIFKMRLRGATAVFIGLFGVVSVYFFIGALGQAWRSGRTPQGSEKPAP